MDRNGAQDFAARQKRAQRRALVAFKKDALMNKLAFVLSIAILLSTSASAKTAPYYEGRWRAAHAAAITSSETKGNTTITRTTKTSSKLAIQICPNSKKTGSNLALILPIGLAVGGTPVKVNPDGSITATIDDGSQGLRFALRQNPQQNQPQLSGTMGSSPTESDPNPPRIPVTFIRTGKC